MFGASRASSARHSTADLKGLSPGPQGEEVLEWGHSGCHSLLSSMALWACQSSYVQKTLFLDSPTGQGSRDLGSCCN